MNKKQLFTQLNSLCREMSCSYDINCGGCCFVAAIIAEQLEVFNIPFKVAITRIPTHYAIKVSDRYINRDDFDFKFFEFYDYNSSYLYDCYYKEHWNPTYNKKWNLIVRTRIKSLFNKYGN